MGRPPSALKQRQLAVALSPETRSRLEAAAAAGDRSLAEEVRRRIDQTIAWERVDPVTMELCKGIENISALLRRDFGAEWHANPRTHEAFLIAVGERLMAYQPPFPKAGATGSDGSVKPGDSTELIGRMRERDDRRISSYKHLQEVERWRAKSMTIPSIKAGAKKEAHHE